jgi:beta-lactamase class A
MGAYRITIGLLLGLVLHLSALANPVSDPEALREDVDPRLQRAVDSNLDALGLRNAARDKRLCLALIDITHPDHPRLAEVNGDYMMYAASLPKIAILLGAFVEIEAGHLRLDDEVRDSLTRMVRVSSNTDATAMLNRVGKTRVNQILQSDRFRLYDRRMNGGLWVGKEYAKANTYAPDPLHNLSHGATALQAARFYYLLETGQLVNPQLTKVMKTMLSEPGIHHKFVKGLESRPGVKIYRKSGTWEQWHADSALVEAQGYKYIIVGLAHDAAGGDWLVKLAPRMHDLIVPTRLAENRSDVTTR